jgi:hypothetical protein
MRKGRGHKSESKCAFQIRTTEEKREKIKFLLKDLKGYNDDVIIEALTILKKLKNSVDILYK